MGRVDAKRRVARQEPEEKEKGRRWWRAEKETDRDRERERVVGEYVN